MLALMDSLDLELVIRTELFEYWEKAPMDEMPEIKARLDNVSHLFKTVRRIASG